jgi:hypothetical protein
MTIGFVFEQMSARNYAKRLQMGVINTVKRQQAHNAK